MRVSDILMFSGLVWLVKEGPEEAPEMPLQEGERAGQVPATARVFLGTQAFLLFSSFSVPFFGFNFSCIYF